MRSWIPVVAILLLAGCLNARPTPTPSVPAHGPGGWTLNCQLGSYESGPWVQDCVARASHTEGPKQEIWLGVNPKDPSNVVIGSKDNRAASSKECVWNGLAVTHDGGASWTDVTIGGDYASRQPTDPWYGYACNTDPMLAFSADGTVHYAVELYNLASPDSHGPLGPDPLTGRPLLLPGWKLVLATSHDGGDTWPQTVTLDQTDGIAAINDYSRMTVGPATGTILEAINTFSGGPFAAASAAFDFCSIIASRDKGKTADVPVRVLSSPDAPQGVGCQGIAGAPDGTYVLGSGGGQTWWSWSTDDGRSFSTPVAGFSYPTIPGQFSESEYRTGTNFELAYDLSSSPHRGTLYLIYADSSRDEADIYVRSSTDQGHTWSDAVRVNDDGEGPHQFMPNVAVASDGSVHAFFMDKRYDPAHRLIDITHAISLDGGKTWTNERVTNQGFDGDLGQHQEGFPFIGDYIGIGASDAVVWGGFPDATVGTTVIAAARVDRLA